MPVETWAQAHTESLRTRYKRGSPRVQPRSSWNNPCKSRGRREGQGLTRSAPRGPEQSAPAALAAPQARPRIKSRKGLRKAWAKGGRWELQAESQGEVLGNIWKGRSLLPAPREA